MAKLHIYLFRHGQTTYNRDGKFTGWHNPDLTRKGVANAKNVGKLLAKKKIDIAIHSGLLRSKHTLDIVLKGHKECEKVIVDKRMRERNYGRLNGKSHDAIIQKLGQKQYDSWHRGWDTPPPGGESFKMVERRVAPFIKDLIRMMKKDKVNVAISAHGNSIRLFRKIMEKASVKSTCEWVIPFDKPYHYVVDVK